MRKVRNRRLKRPFHRVITALTVTALVISLLFTYGGSASYAEDPEVLTPGEGSSVPEHEIVVEFVDGTDTLVYTGETQYPTLLVKLDGVELEEGEGYLLERPETSIEVGDYSLYVYVLTDEEGHKVEVVKQYSIVEPEPEHEIVVEFVDGTDTLVYTGETQYPTLRVILDGVELEEGEGYYELEFPEDSLEVGDYSVCVYVMTDEGRDPVKVVKQYSIVEPKPDPEPVRGSVTTTITVDPTEPGNEYLVAAKGTPLSDLDWSKAKLSQHGEALSFGSEYEIIPGSEYTVYHRTPGDATHEPGEPVSSNYKAPRSASADHADGLSAEGGVAPMIDANGCYLTKDGRRVGIGPDGKYYIANEQGFIASGATPLTRNGDGSLSDGSRRIEFVPAVMVVGLNPDAEDNVKGKLDSVPVNDASVAVASPVYDAQEHSPSAYDNSVIDSAGIPKGLEKGRDYIIQYYSAKDIDDATGLPKAGAQPLNTTDPNADNYAFDANEVVAVVTFQGDYAGTISTPVKIQKKSFHCVTPSAEKEYDGAPLVAPQPAVYCLDNGTRTEGLVAGQTVEIHASSSQIGVGSSASTFQLRFRGEAPPSPAKRSSPKLSLVSLLIAGTAYADDYDGLTQEGEEPTAKRGNYEVIAEYGTLTIKPYNAQDDAGGRIRITLAEKSRKPVIQDTAIKTALGRIPNLAEGTDYDLACYRKADMDPVTKMPKAGAVPVKDPTDPGDYSLVVTFKGNYRGTRVLSLSIPKADSSSTQTAKSDTSPSTGDEAPLEKLIVCLVLSMSALILSVVWYRKKGSARS